MSKIKKSFAGLAIGSFIAGVTTFGVVPTASLASGVCVNPGGTGGCYNTIQKAVNAASAGSTIEIAAGTYHEHVLVSKALRIMGAGASSTIINAARPASQTKSAWFGLHIQNVNTTTVVSGITVENAPLAGILLWKSSHVLVKNTIVTNNDKNLKVGKTESTCAGAPPFEQDDCGEGIMLNGVSYSTIRSNSVEANAGGILVTDEVASTHNVRIANNSVSNNPYDCGITLASHPRGFKGNNPLPGHDIHDVLVVHNVSNGNGGAGAGIFTPTPGTNAYNNTIRANILSGNGLAGVTMHEHAPQQNLNGNKIVGNWIGRNNMFGDGDSGDMKTTGILIASAAPQTVDNTVITGNTIIGGNFYGIWTWHTNKTVRHGNFIRADVPVFHHK